MSEDDQKHKFEENTDESCDPFTTQVNQSVSENIHRYLNAIKLKLDAMSSPERVTIFHWLKKWSKQVLFNFRFFLYFHSPKVTLILTFIVAATWKDAMGCVYIIFLGIILFMGRQKKSCGDRVKSIQRSNLLPVSKKIYIFSIIILY